MANSTVELLPILEHLDHLIDLHPPRFSVLCIIKPDHNGIDVGAVQRPEECLLFLALLECFNQILGQFRTARRAVGSVPPAITPCRCYLPSAGRLHFSLTYQYLGAFDVHL